MSNFLNENELQDVARIVKLVNDIDLTTENISTNFGEQTFSIFDVNGDVLGRIAMSDGGEFVFFLGEPEEPVKVFSVESDGERRDPRWSCDA